VSGGSSYVVGIVGLLLLVLVHEAGHFFVARAVGMKPTKFYLGFPPAVIRRVRNGIEYGVGAIPLGGYVKIPGMFRPAERDTQRYFGPLLEQRSEQIDVVDDIRHALVRSNTAAAHQALDTLERSLAGLPASPVTSLAHNGVEELREGLSPYAYWRQTTWRKVAVIAAGPAANILAAIVLLTAVNVLGLPTAIGSTSVLKVLPNSAAARAGIHAGDTIIALDGTVVNDATIARRIIQHGKGAPVHVVVVRDRNIADLGLVTPRKTKDGYILGVDFHTRVYYRKDNPARAAGRATREVWQVATQIVTGLPRLVHPQQRKQVSSVVGIVHVSGDALRTDYRDYLSIVALISISLGILNLLPFLPLDGGHILVALVERARRRALRRDVVERFSIVGFALVGLLMYIGLTNDVHRYF
jgi:regulator of sigma E protease